MTLYGLVLAGGLSTRMGQDKGLLDYHGQPQRFYLADMLRSYCAQVYISVNPHQAQLQADQYAYLVDAPQWAGMGPPGAVLGAHLRFPDVCLWVVSCDLPFFGPACAQLLVGQRDETVDATAFFNPEIQAPEPLIAIYEQKFLQTLPPAFKSGERSLRRLLGNANVKLLHDYDVRCIHSADRPEDYRAAKS